MLDKKVGGREGNFCIQRHNDPGEHGSRDRFCRIRCALLESDLPNLGHHDTGDDEIRELAEDWGEMTGVRAVVEAFEPGGGIKNVGRHGVSS